MLDESPSIQQRQRKQERKEVLSNVPVKPSSGESENDGRPRVEANRDMSLERQEDSKQELSEPTMLAKKIDEPPDVSIVYGFCVQVISSAEIIGVNWRRSRRGRNCPRRNCRTTKPTKPTDRVPA